MPNFDIIRQSKPNKSFRVASIMGTYDLQSNDITERFVGDINFEDLDWQIGLIVGNSGTGKTTIAKELFPNAYITNSMTFRKCEGQKKNRPKCELKIYETKEKQYYWNIFRKHHYLNNSLNNAARVFIATLNDDLCAFTSILQFPHPRKKNFYREHRTVVLPDFQGLGISMFLTNFIIEKILIPNGKGYITTTSNPSRINGLIKSGLFRITRKGSVSGGNGKIQSKYKKGSTSNNRITVSFEYIGNKNN